MGKGRKEIMKAKLLEYIQKKSPTKNVVEVLKFDVKDWDDENGAMGEHYVVTCTVTTISPKSPTGWLEDVEKECLVCIKQFKRYVEEEKAVKWLKREE